MLRNSQTGYGKVSIVLHWGIALLLVLLFILGWYMTELTYYDRWYKRSFELHKVFGVVVFILILFRLLWVSINSRPALPQAMERWETVAAETVHRLLYLLMLLIPVSGYLISTADGVGVDFFGWFEVPALLPAEEGREEWAGRVHYFLAFGGGWLVLAHAGAALKHHFIDRDDTLIKMLR